MTIQWWCAARGTPWTWVWQAYPGIWLFVLAVAGAGVALPRVGTTGGMAPRTTRQRYLAVAGLIVLWIALDWPLGLLGAGYLLTAHTAQFLLVTGVAAPSLLVAHQPVLRGWAQPRLERSEALRLLTHPLGAALAFGAILVGTHVPAVVDRLLITAWGTCAIDLAWLAAGLLFWWPVVIAMPTPPRVVAPARMLYLFLAGVPSHAVGAFVTLASYPLYALYELAPRVEGLSARSDQQTAGLLMWLGMPAVTLIALSAVFFRWAREHEEAETAPVSRGALTAPAAHDRLGRSA